MSIVLHYIDKNGRVIERFLGLVHVLDTSAISLKLALESLFSKHSLSLSWVCGQGYDGANNMQVGFNGLKSLILKENNFAFYVHCFAHQLQLALMIVANKQVEFGCLLIATSICYFLFINVWQLLKAWVWILSDSPTWVFNLYILFFLIWKTVDRKCISIFLFSNVKSPKITIQTKCDIFWYTIFQPILNFENQSGLNFQNRVPNFRFRKSCFLGWQGPFCK